METTVLGPLRVRRLVTGGATRENNGESPPDAVQREPLVCVLLHGFGAPGDDLVGLAGGLDVPPGTVFVFPEALHALQDFVSQPLFGDARAWWMIDFAALERAMARGELRDLTGAAPEGLVEARTAVNEMLAALSKEISTKHRLVLGGFSQGAMLSLDVTLRDPSRAVAGVVQLSGTLVAAHEWTPLMPTRVGLPVFQSHGENDPILPFAIAERLRDAMKTAGLDVTFDPFAGPHTIPQRTLARLGAWLRALP